GSLTLSNVPSGNHIFKITASGYNTWLNTVYIQANMVNTISAPLTSSGSGPSPVTATGGLDISTSPAGASVYVDDLFRGYAPLTLTDLVVGQHTVQISYTGYVDYTGTVSVSTGVTTPLAVTLQQGPNPNPTKTPGFEAVFAITGLVALAGVMAVYRRRS
ncbi:MAG: PEGA domain-containing protein, partial [Methanoregula sp.]